MAEAAAASPQGWNFLGGTPSKATELKESAAFPLHHPAPRAQYPHPRRRAQLSGRRGLRSGARLQSKTPRCCAAGPPAFAHKSAAEILSSGGLVPLNSFCFGLAFFSRQTASEQHITEWANTIRYTNHCACATARVGNAAVCIPAIQMTALFARETLFGKTLRPS